MPKKKHLFCKLRLFSQNSNIFHFPDNFFHIQKAYWWIEYCRYQTENVICAKLTIKTPRWRNEVVLVSLLLTLNRFSHRGLFVLLLAQVNARYAADCCFYHISVALVIFISRTAAESAIKPYKNRWHWWWWLRWGVGANKRIDMILFYDFHLFLFWSNNWRDAILSYDSIHRQFHQISPNHDYWKVLWKKILRILKI